jgi:hypothetical protein
MGKKFLIFFILSLLCINCAIASTVFEHPQRVDAIVTEIPTLKSISCKFKQEKSMPNSTVTIKSGGNFKFVKNEGVFFETTYPIHNVTSYTTKDYKQINEIINAISNKSYSRIERQFNFYFTKKSNFWQIGLVPKKSVKTAKYLSSIEIDGTSYITKIIILTKNSVKTTIFFMK